MHNKLYIVFGVLCILFVALIFRLMYIEYTSGEKYEKIVLSQQEYDSTIIPYKRGDIVDSKGTVLATSVDVYNVILDSKVLHANEEKISSTIAYLTQCFPEITADQVNQEITDNPDREYTVLAKHVSYEEKAAFEALMNGEDTKDQIAGIWFEKEYTRTYPYNSLASAMIGFANATTGVIGLENQYNDTLNGTNGRSYGYLNADSNLEQTVIEPENGYSLVATIDTNIQSIVESAILQANEEMKQETEGQATGSNNTAVLVMDPQNGDVLAMASYPNFDLNNPKDLSAYFTEEELAGMSDEDKMNQLNKLWQNYTISNTFEPGSTFKPFTEAMGLDSGSLRGDETYICDGSEWVSGHEIHCVNRSGHGTEDLRGALRDSCNDALMQMVRAIGPANFAKYSREYGFGQKTGIDLPGEASTASLIFSEEQLARTESNLAVSSFGQGFNVTMIQLASSFCSLINGGNIYQPHVVKKIVDGSGNTVQEISPVVTKETVSQEVSDTLRDYMYTVVSEGTGAKAAVEGYAIGGKTGTAEKVPRGSGNYVVSFIGFAPVDDPQVVVYVVVDEPHVADQSHCSQSSYIAKNIFSQILPYMNIERMDSVAAE
ncbi:penicillin-binding protein 2 [Roseburia sp. NSJ-9]|mgnify:CR=1 FL=1|jgi:stage V sporulation protein D (sporulation-specific penicillin-binding protein)|uniref:Penicillin-binding protein 2 n=1 Tax=Roseburia lenta TaxID=2763061 RepID=A0ABR7GII0_9FIRM|nr:MULTISPECIES: penicillin-binding protein 2 [Roseburia]MBC5687115.1 penicillin-binding protein 2 [Roseburia lenta]